MEDESEGKLETGPAENHAAPPRGARVKGLNMLGPLGVWGFGRCGVLGVGLLMVGCGFFGRWLLIGGRVLVVKEG